MRSGPRSRVVPQSFADFVHEGFAREGLLQEEALLQEVIVAPVIFEVAGHVNDPQLRPEALESFGEFRSSHLGHHDIGKQQMDRLVCTSPVSVYQTLGPITWRGELVSDSNP